MGVELSAAKEQKELAKHTEFQRRLGILFVSLDPEEELTEEVFEAAMCGFSDEASVSS